MTARHDCRGVIKRLAGCIDRERTAAQPIDERTGRIDGTRITLKTKKGPVEAIRASDRITDLNQGMHGSNLNTFVPQCGEFGRR